MFLLPQWDQSILGLAIDVVLQSVLQDCDGHAVMRVLGANQHVEVHGAVLGKGALFTFLGVKVAAVTPRPILQVDATTRVFVHPPTSLASVRQCIELCAGAGFMGQGAIASGFTPILGIEQNARFSTLYGLQHEGKFICKDIGHPDAVAEALTNGASGATVLSGFSCQPYSCAGDRRGFRDSRADALPSSLRFAWLVQSPVVVLECTPLAKDDPNVQQVLSDFAKLSGFQIIQQVLRLNNCWAARRDRWWCVMMPKVLGPLTIPDLPHMPEFQIISGVMPYVRHWPDTEIAQLVLSMYEHMKFLDYAGPLESLALDLTKALPTALHAWGNQIYPCGCGCRGGFSDDRMRTRGLHGVLIPGQTMLQQDGLTFPECRHLHPAEVLLLCGGRPDIQFDSMRLGLAAVGQLASPIQCLWVLSHIRRTIAAFAGEDAPDPHQVLCEYQNSLLHCRDQMWPPVKSPKLVPTRTQPHMQDADKSDGVEIHHVGPEPIAVQRVGFSPGQTVGQLCQAEASIRQIPAHALRVETVEGRARDLQSCLVGGDIVVLVQAEDKVAPPLKALEDQKHTSTQPDVVAPSAPQGSLPSVSVGAEDTRGHVQTKDRLCHVPKDGLLKLLVPTVATIESLQGLRTQLIDGKFRKEVLTTQEDLWADDQILFHLTHLAHHASIEQAVHVWDPLATTSLLRSPHSRVISSWADDLPPRATIITAVLADHHWVPIVWRWAEQKLDGFSYGIPFRFRSSFDSLHQWVCKALGSEFTALKNVPSEVESHCGAAAIAYVRHLLQAQTMTDSSSIEACHQDLCRQFAQSLSSKCSRPWIWGQGTLDSSSDSALIALLRQHGVPASEASERASQVCRALGNDKVQDALKKSSPWKELKWIANQCVPMFKLVRPHELQQAIETRAQSSLSVGTKALKNKGHGKGKTSSTIDPGSVRITEGTFVTKSDQVVGQIPVSQIGPLQVGVVLATLDQALPYISQNRQVSLGGLAIIVLNMPDTPPGLPLIAEKVTFPAVCAANSEPLILTGSMFQLGASPVTRAVASNVMALRSIQTSVVKLAVYRDVLGLPWTDFVGRPMHHLLALLPQLTPCRDEGCSTCQHWHGDDKEVRDPILAVWNRQWLSHSFAVVQPSDADFFSITLRIPSELEESVLALSGSNAVCVEPREQDGRQVSKAYQVIWLPRHTAAQTMVLRQTTPGIVGIARLGNRWGVRCKVADAASVHQQVKPDAEYLPSGKKQLFLLGPVPFGTLKQSIVEACKKLQWSARPLQAIPAARNVSGIMWKIQALTNPPCHHLQLASGDAVITRVDASAAHVVEPQPVVGSAVTKQLCQVEPGQDLLQIHDPWAKAIRNKGEVAVESEPHTGAARALEEQVVQSVLSRIPTPMIDDDDKDARLNALEARVQQLTDQGQTLQNAFQDHTCAQTQQLNSLQSQFQAQHTSLEHAVHEQGIQLQGLSGQLQTQLQRQEHRLDDMFAVQMSKLETLLGSKKPRHE